MSGLIEFLEPYTFLLIDMTSGRYGFTQMVTMTDFFCLFCMCDRFLCTSTAKTDRQCFNSEAFVFPALIAVAQSTDGTRIPTLGGCLSIPPNTQSRNLHFLLLEYYYKFCFYVLALSRKIHQNPSWVTSFDGS